MEQRNVFFIGFDIEAVGGISTYSRYQIQALKEFENINLEVYSLKTLDIKYKNYVTHTINYSSRTDIVKLFFILLNKVNKNDLLIFNHVNLSIIGFLLKKIKKTQYIVNVYNSEILKKLSVDKTIGLKNADIIISDCQHTINNISNFHGRIPRLELLYDPVDTNFFKPMDKNEIRKIIFDQLNLNIQIDDFILVTVAKMRKNSNKGHIQIIKSLKKLNKSNIHYLIVGNGDDMDNIKEFSKEQATDKNVHFLGSVPHETLPLLYNVSDVVTLISKSNYGKGEGVPLGLLEGMACRKPIICGNEDGSLEAISEENPNGFSINPLDINNISNSISSYYTKGELLDEHGASSIKYINEFFSFNIFSKKLAKILNAI